MEWNDSLVRGRGGVGEEGALSGTTPRDKQRNNKEENIWLATTLATMVNTLVRFNNTEG